MRLSNHQQTDKETKIFSDFAAQSKKQRGIDPRKPQSQNHSEDMYAIDEEIEQLKEIKDIQDELHILSVLLDNQKTVLKQAMAALKYYTDDRGKTPKSPMTTPGTPGRDFRESDTELYSAANNFEKLFMMVDEQDNRRHGLETQAEQANKAVWSYSI